MTLKQAADVTGKSESTMRGTKPRQLLDWQKPSSGQGLQPTYSHPRNSALSFRALGLRVDRLAIRRRFSPPLPALLLGHAIVKLNFA
jgi:hypothetical protein